MDYNVIENVSESRYSAIIKFTGNILPFFSDGDFDIAIMDLVLNNIVEISDYNTLINDYGYTAVPRSVPGKTDAQVNEEDSLVKNGGIIITLQGSDTISIIMAPRCSNPDKSNTIGYCSAEINIKAKYNDDFIDVNFIAKLYPKIIRSDNIVKMDPTAIDPVLPNDVERACYTFPVDFDSNKKISQDFEYNTTDSIYVNTQSETPTEEQVPVYVSELSAYFIDDPYAVIKPDWNNYKSYLYNENSVKTDIPAVIDDPELLTINVLETITDDYTPVEYTADISAYKVTQLIYTDNPGKFENKLVFSIGVTDK
jgi:hypothetical protein